MVQLGPDPICIIFQEKAVYSLGNNLFPTIMEYQKNEYGEPAKKDKTEIAAKILAILGFIIWCGWHVFSGWESF